MGSGWRRVAGAVAEFAGKYIVPPVVGVGVAYGTDQHLAALQYSAIVGSVVAPAFLLGIGGWLRTGGRQDESLQIALEVLVRNILSPPESTDPLCPTLRATVFVPGKQGKEERLLPRFRIDSAPNTKVLRQGEPTFTQGANFKRGDAFAGQTWESGREVCQSLKALSDFPGTDEERLAAWRRQWDGLGAASPQMWSPYMRSVRSLWTFAIPGPKKETLAVFSVDSTHANAFGVLEESDSALTSKQGEMFQGINLREAVAALIAGIVLTGLGRHRRDGFFRDAFRRAPPP